MREHPKPVTTPLRAARPPLSGKDKADILDRKVAELKKSKLKRMEIGMGMMMGAGSPEAIRHLRERDPQNRRLNKIYANFRSPKGRDSGAGARRTKSDGGSTPESSTSSPSRSNGSSSLPNERELHEITNRSLEEIDGSSSDSPSKSGRNSGSFIVPPSPCGSVASVDDAVLNSSPVRAKDRRRSSYNSRGHISGGRKRTLRAGSGESSSSNPSTPSPRKKRVAFSSDIGQVPELSSPVRPATVSSPQPIMRRSNSESPVAKISLVDMLRRDLGKEKSWPLGYVFQLPPGHPGTEQVVDGCVRALQDRYFPKKNLVFASLLYLVKSADKGSDPFTKDQAQHICRAIEVDAAQTAEAMARQDEDDSLPFKTQTCTTGLKVLLFIMKHYQISNAMTLLKRISNLLCSPNLPRGMCIVLLLLIKEQQAHLPASAVELITSNVLRVKEFKSSTAVPDKLAALTEMIKSHPAVMNKMNYEWLSYALFCIMNVDMPKYKNSLDNSMLLLRQFAANSESKTVVLSLLNETINDNSSMSKASLDTLKTLTPQTKVSDSVASSLISLIDNGDDFAQPALKIWCYLTFMVGYRGENRQDLDEWPGFKNWRKVFDEGIRSTSSLTREMTLNAWKGVVYCYHCSPSFSSSKLTQEDLNRKMKVLMYPFTCIPKDECSRRLVEGYKLLYHRIARLMRHLAISPTTKNVVGQEWILHTMLAPFYQVFLRRPEFIPVGEGMLIDLLKFKERANVDSLDNPENCFHKNTYNGWTLSCLPKSLLRNNFAIYYAAIGYAIERSLISSEAKTKVFNEFTKAFEQSARNADISPDAMNGFISLVGTYLVSVRDDINAGRMDRPSVEDLCQNIILRAKSIFGLNVLTGETCKTNLVSTLGNFVFHWHGPIGIREFVEYLYQLLNKKAASLYHGLTLLKDKDVEPILLDELRNPDMDLSVFFTEQAKWKEVYLKLKLYTDNFDIIAKKIIEFKPHEHQHEIEKFINDFTDLLPEAMHTDALGTLLAKYAQYPSDKEDFSLMDSQLEQFLDRCNKKQLLSLVAGLPSNKLPYFWYETLMQRVVDLNWGSTNTEVINTWLRNSVEYLQNNFPDRCRDFYDITKGTSYEMELFNLVPGLFKKAEESKKRKKAETEQRMREQLRKSILEGTRSPVVLKLHGPDHDTQVVDQDESEEKTDDSVVGEPQHPPELEKEESEIQVNGSGSNSSSDNRNQQKDQDAITSLSGSVESSNGGSNDSSTVQVAMTNSDGEKDDQPRLVEVVQKTLPSQESIMVMAHSTAKEASGESSTQADSVTDGMTEEIYDLPRRKRKVEETRDMNHTPKKRLRDRLKEVEEEMNSVMQLKQLLSHLSDNPDELSGLPASELADLEENLLHQALQVSQLRRERQQQEKSR